MAKKDDKKAKKQDKSAKKPAEAKKSSELTESELDKLAGGVLNCAPPAPKDRWPPPPSK